MADKFEQVSQNGNMFTKLTAVRPAILFVLSVWQSWEITYPKHEYSIKEDAYG